MKTVMKSLVLGVALAAASGSASAITAGGVTWDENSLFDFSATDTMIELGAVAVGDTLDGYALIQNINNTTQSVYCASGCEVTYLFGGYTITSIDAATNTLVFSGGFIDVYVDSTPNYNGNYSTAADGTLFLSLVGTLHYDVSTGLFGTLFSDPVPASVEDVAGDGRGYLDVTGGLAAAYFDTNTKAIDTDGDGIADSFADFQFTSSFQLIPGGSFLADNGVEYDLFGSNDIQGNSAAVPEPGSLALLGIGLAGLGMSFRRRKSS